MVFLHGQAFSTCDSSFHTVQQSQYYRGFLFKSDIELRYSDNPFSSYCLIHSHEGVISVNAKTNGLTKGKSHVYLLNTCCMISKIYQMIPTALIYISM